MAQNPISRDTERLPAPVRDPRFLDAKA